VRAAEIRYAGVTGNGRDGFELAAFRLETLPALVCVPGGLTGSQQGQNTRAGFNAQGLHAGDGRVNAGRIPKLERAHLPVESGAQGAVDGSYISGHFADPVGGIVPQAGKQGP
jgi:hypothetical protein